MEDSLSRSEKLAYGQLKLKEFQRAKARKNEDQGQLCLANGGPASTSSDKLLSSQLEGRAFVGTAYAKPPSTATSDEGSRKRSLADYFGNSDAADDAVASPCLVTASEHQPGLQSIFSPSSLLTHSIHPLVWNNDTGGGEAGLKPMPESQHKPRDDPAATIDPRSFKDTSAAANQSQLPSSSAMPTETTEKVMQLTNQLDGILRTSEYLLTSRSPAGTFSQAGNSVGMNSIPVETGDQSGSLKYLRDLETRNLELAGLLERQNRLHERALAKLTASQEQATRSASEAATEVSRLRLSSQRDVAKAQEQIRAHAQTIGALVAEKTELQSTTTHLQRLAEQRAEEIEAIDKRLQNLRQQNVNLERSVGAFKAELEKRASDCTDLTTQVERCRSEITRERQARENLEVELSENRSRLTARNQEVTHLEVSLSELKRQLEMSQVYASQLRQTSGHSTVTSTPQLDGADALPRQPLMGDEVDEERRIDWLAERAEVTARLHELEATLGRMEKEKTRLESQYKLFVSQMEQQNNDLRAQLSTSNRNRDDLEVNLEAARKGLREKDDEIVQFKRTLAAWTLHQGQEAPEADGKTVQVESTVPDSMELQEEITRLSKDFQASRLEASQLTSEVDRLQKQLAAGEALVKEKEDLLADREVVLQTAVSEKAALSRAVAQNRSLKDQLAELQDAFVDLSNKNMGLTTRLQQEEHNRNLATAALSAAESKLFSLSTIHQRDSNLLPGDQQQQQQREVTAQLDVSQVAHTCAGLHDNQVCESHPQGHDELSSHDTGEDVDRLKLQLHQCHATIDCLTVEADQTQTVLHRLRLLFDWLKEQQQQPDFEDRYVVSATSTKSLRPQRENATTGLSRFTSQVAQQQQQQETTVPADATRLEASPHPLDLLARFDKLLRSVISSRDQEIARQAKQNRDNLVRIQTLPSADSWQQLQLAHSQLEAKFVDCMAQLSRASEERCRLEEVIGQLQMEASTVGEYVTLFAHRRSNAAKRAKARERLLARLVEDRCRLRVSLKDIQAAAQHLIQGRESLDQSTDTAVDTGSTQMTDLVEKVNHFLATVAAPSEDEEQANVDVPNDEEAEGDGPSSVETRCSHSGSGVPWEQLRQQVLQHDCPHCKCCVGTLLEV